MKKENLKIIIIGGGIGGAALALFLKKAGFYSEVFEARQSEDKSGGGLGLAPNGLAVLVNLDLNQKVIDTGTIVKYGWFRNAKGKTLAKIPYSIPEIYDHPCVSLSRASLNEILATELQKQNIPLHYSKRLKQVIEIGTKVKVVFEDGTSAEGDILVGAEGIGSLVRKHLLPHGPNPEFTGIISAGGFVKTDQIKGLDKDSIASLNFIYGKSGFFGFGGANKGELMWWTNLRVKKPYTHEELINFSISEEKKQLMKDYGHYAFPVSEIIRQCEKPIRINIFDIQSLPFWYKKNIILIGDAAHAVSPNAGQGASMALEDAMMLAKMFRDEPTIEAAFSKFQSLRKPRVEKIVEEGRRRGDDKEIVGPFKQFIRELMVRIFVNLFGVKGNKWLFEYKIDWNQKEI